MGFKKQHIPWNKGLGTKINNCKNCGKPFSVIRARIKDKRGKFCSLKCHWNYKYKLSSEIVLTPNISELVGVIIGDGCLFNPYKNTDSHTITIRGNPIEDKTYMEYYLPKLIKKCLKKKVKPFIAPNGAYIIIFSDEPFRIFLNRLGIKPNKTKTVNIPIEIIKKHELLVRCIRGIADTDFTFIAANKNGRKNVYPRITSHFASKNLVEDLEESLRNLGFTLNTKYKVIRLDKRGFITLSNYINLDGPHNLNKWLKLIGFKNMRIITRYKYWEKFGYLPPKTTLSQRMKALGLEEGD